MNRTDLLNHLAEKYNLQRYLEIGLNEPKDNFDKISCKVKIAVDPSEKAKENFYRDAWRKHFHLFFQDTSDTFFDSWSRRPSDFVCTEAENKFDLIFLDGLHTAEQVKKDFDNALKVLSPNGFIVLHDCNPEKEEHTIVPRPTVRGHWNGDVWRFAAGFPDYDHSWRWTVDIDNGCTVFWNRKEAFEEVVHCGISEMPWSHFDANRKELLNLISWDEFTNS